MDKKVAVQRTQLENLQKSKGQFDHKLKRTEQQNMKLSHISDAKTGGDLANQEQALNKKQKESENKL